MNLIILSWTCVRAFFEPGCVGHKGNTVMEQHRHQTEQTLHILRQPPQTNMHILTHANKLVSQRIKINAPIAQYLAHRRSQTCKCFHADVGSTNTKVQMWLTSGETWHAQNTDCIHTHCGKQPPWQQQEARYKRLQSTAGGKDTPAFSGPDIRWYTALLNQHRASREHGKTSSSQVIG